VKYLAGSSPSPQQVIHQFLFLDEVPVGEVFGLLRMLEQVRHRDHALVQSPQELERSYPVAVSGQEEDLAEVFGNVPTEHKRETFMRAFSIAAFPPILS